MIIIGYFLLSIIALVFVYFLLVLLGSIIPVNSSYRNFDQGIEIGVSSNGVHADIVVPAMNHLFDWSKIVQSSDYEIPLSQNSYLGIGWGDRGFYLDIPTWGDLTVKIAIRALFLPSPTVMHVTSYTDHPSTFKSYERVFLNEQQYLHLCKYIVQFFRLENEKVKKIPNVGYTPSDNFYEAMGSYHAFNTCNFWVNRALHHIGVRTTLWCPIDRGIFYQLKKIDR